MKYKLIFLVCFIFFLLFVYISFLNPHTTKLYLGGDRSYETSIANWVAGAFILGVIVALIISFVSDVHRSLKGWRESKKEKRNGDAPESFQKAKTEELKGKPEVRDDQ